MAAEMDLQVDAALNIGRNVLNIDEVVWQTVFVSPDDLALAAVNTSPCRVVEDSAILFSRSPHETSGSPPPHPANKSDKMNRQGKNLRIVPSG
jgi:hypothetical protein